MRPLHETDCPRSPATSRRSSKLAIAGRGDGPFCPTQLAWFGCLSIFGWRNRKCGPPYSYNVACNWPGSTGVQWCFSSNIVFPARKSLPHRCFDAMCISMGLEAGMGLSMDRNGRWWLGLVLAPTRRLSTMALETRINRDHTN